MTAKTLAQRVEASKARKREQGLVEVRSLWAHPDDVPAIRQFAADLAAQRKGNTMQTIKFKADPLLAVYIDREKSSEPVRYRYDDHDCQSTPFQTADMPMDDQAAAKMVNDWIDG